MGRFKSTYTLDREKLEAAKKASGSSTATQAIERGLDLLIQQEAQAQLWEFMMSPAMSGLDNPAVSRRAKG